MKPVSDLASLQATIGGKVQGVFFRAFVSRVAHSQGVVGYVRNLPGGQVEVVAEGEREQLEKLLAQLRIGPTQARVDNVDYRWSGFSGRYTLFQIRY